MKRLSLLLLLLAGCATPSARHSNTSSLPVPFIAQKANYCGPAALAMVAEYYGHHVTQDEIASAIYLPAIRGTLTTDLANYARRYDLWTRQYRGSISDLHQKIAAGVPMIVLGRLGGNWHYFVVLGFDDFARTLTVHSDTRPDLTLSRDEFERWWYDAGRWTLLVCPPGKIDWEMSADEQNDLGVFLEHTGKFTAAEQHYRQAVKLDPHNSYYEMNLGNALMKQQKFKEAAEAFERAVKLAPENADAANNLAWAYCEQDANLWRAAVLCYRAIELQPSHRAYYLDTLGSVRMKQHEFKEAVDVFSSALEATSPHQNALRAGIQERLEAAKKALHE
jgi:tetratricopeptide (TPR) repeat protein